MVEIFTLPEEFIPNMTSYCLCQGSNKNTWLLTVSKNGQVSFSRYGTTSVASAGTDAWLPFNFSFIAQ